MLFFRPLLQKNNLTEQQWRVLRALKAYDELESKQLADLCCILSPSLTGIIKRLEQQGYIEKRKSAEDQRRTLIKLTEQALQLFEQISPEVDAHYQLFAERFGKEKLDQLSTLLQELASIKP
jgi:homoprotocatechuate degradation regulator HpaR